MVDTITYKCERLLRELGNNLTLYRSNTLDSNENILRHLKFEPKKIRSFWSAMDIIKDTEYAKEYFLNTFHQSHSIGENRIRLYGILNLIYAERKAILTLAELSKDKNIKKYMGIFRQCKILELRNKAASHTLDFKDRSSIVVYTINASVWRNIITISSTNQYVEYNIKYLIEEYNMQSSEIMIQITRKFVSTWLKNGGDKKIKYEQMLSKIISFNNSETITENDNRF